MALCCCWLVEDDGHLLHVATHAEHRREGIAAELITHVASRARIAECRVLHFEVASAHAAAIGLYRHCGFAEVGRRRGYDRQPVPDDAV